MLQQIERSYGRGSILKLGDAGGMTVDCIGSGALTLGESRVPFVYFFVGFHDQRLTRTFRRLTHVS